jgi:hypothetical protein
MHLYCARSRFSKCQPFECTSIAPGHAFQNASHLNAALAVVRHFMERHPVLQRLLGWSGQKSLKYGIV